MGSTATTVANAAGAVITRTLLGIFVGIAAGIAVFVVEKSAGWLDTTGWARAAIWALLPVYMAAPWYLYWPYDGHFQTVAPPAMNAAFYPPPAYTGNPYLSGRSPGYLPNNPIPEFPMGKK